MQVYKIMTYFITGTDTEIGKTVVSAWAMLHLGAQYWKPVQSGLDDGTDAGTIKNLTECPDEDIYPSSYVLTQPLSPHESAKRDGVVLSLDEMVMPQTDRPLIVEGAGGLMVPLNDEQYIIDLIAHLNIPSLLVARSGLGTINHTLLSLKAMRDRGLTVAGVVMVGDLSPHNRQAIEQYGHIDVLAEIPKLDPLNRDALLSIKPEKDL